MTVFTKEVMRNYRSSMLKEMEEVAKKYGVKVEFGNIRFNATDSRGCNFIRTYYVNSDWIF